MLLIVEAKVVRIENTLLFAAMNALYIFLMEHLLQLIPQKQSKIHQPAFIHSKLRQVGA